MFRSIVIITAGVVAVKATMAFINKLADKS